jgi:trans-2,3-dihydro-3-hydroxyanthranilate isomerase
MPNLRFVICDVFTDRPLSGNQLAVFTNAAALGSDMMQALAREVGFSETVFVLPAEGEGHARIRIFTPRREIPFAGHPTLGTAFVLGQPMQLTAIRLETGAGVVQVQLEREGARVVFGRMTQPLPRVFTDVDGESVLRALGLTRSELPIERYELGPNHVYVALGSRDAVARVQPDLIALAEATPACVNVFSGEGTRYKSRTFAPALGVAEDPATGSAAGPLAVHLCRHGRLAYGQQIEIEQGAELQRPSRLYAVAHGTDEHLERVEVAGAAVTVASGEFRIRS